MAASSTNLFGKSDLRQADESPHDHIHRVLSKYPTHFSSETQPTNYSKVVWIRFNPDSFSVGGVKQRFPLREKYDLLLRTLETASRALTLSTSTYSIVYINYDLEHDP